MYLYVDPAGGHPRHEHGLCLRQPSVVGLLQVILPLLEASGCPTLLPGRERRRGHPGTAAKGTDQFAQFFKVY